MEEYKTYTAKTVDDAILEASLDLGTSRDNIDYKIIERETKGFLGIGARKAVIEARRKMTEEEMVNEALMEKTGKTAKKDKKNGRDKKRRPREKTDGKGSKDTRDVKNNKESGNNHPSKDSKAGKEVKEEKAEKSREEREGREVRKDRQGVQKRPADQRP